MAMRTTPAIAPVTPFEALLLSVLAATTANTAAIETNTMELRGLREALTRDRRPSPLSREDRTRLTKLLPAIGGVVGSELFLVHELFESGSAALRVALRGMNAMQVGRLLRRAVGVPIGGLLVEREATEAGVVLWRVVQVSGVQGNENPFVPRAPREGREE
jgi:hypothetical protein